MGALTEDLARHHRRCDQLLERACAACAARDLGAAVAALDCYRAALERHFAQEEEVVYPAYESRSGRAQGPTRALRFEHDHIRLLLQKARVALYERDGADGESGVRRLAVAVHQHQNREERLMFPLLDELLAGRDAVLAAVIQSRPAP
jgi:iron-sulfur cluster repair protein YtfE (RIC family)